MAIEMKFASFPIEKLCHDLKVEVLEGMELKDKLELFKVNAGFERMLSRHPSLVFDDHVDTVRLENGRIWLKKFPDSPDGMTLDFDRYFAFLKCIDSCDSLWIQPGRGGLNDQHKEFLQGLKSVKNLYLSLHDSGALSVVVESFRVSIKGYALLDVKPSAFEDDPEIQKRFDEFIETRLSDCQRVDLHFRSHISFDFYNNVLRKMRVGFVKMLTTTPVFDWIVSSIVEHGVPSQNVAASVRVDGGRAWGRNPEIIAVLTNYPRMQRIEGDDRKKLVRLGNDRLSGEASLFDAESPCFRRNIDQVKDCVYICTSGLEFTDFFAFYVPTSVC